MDRGYSPTTAPAPAITPAYPELAALATALGSRAAVLDGEGRSDFERLQSRMGLAGSPAKAARMATKIPAPLMLFDIVFLDAHDLTAARTPSAAPWPGLPGRPRRRSSAMGSKHWR